MGESASARNTTRLAIPEKRILEIFALSSFHSSIIFPFFPLNQLGSSSAILFSFFIYFSVIFHNLSYILFTFTSSLLIFLFTPSLSMLLSCVFGISVQYLCSFSSRILLCVCYIYAVFVFLLLEFLVVCLLYLCSICVPSPRVSCCVFGISMQYLCSFSSRILCVWYNCAVFVFLLLAYLVVCLLYLCSICVPSPRVSCCVFVISVPYLCSFFLSFLLCVCYICAVFVFLLLAYLVVCLVYLCSICVPSPRVSCVFGISV